MSPFRPGDRVKLSELGQERRVCPLAMHKRASVRGVVTKVTRRGTIHVRLDGTGAVRGCEYAAEFWARE